MNKKYKLLTAVVSSIIALLLTFPLPAYSHKKHLHFSHPLIAESPTPDTKVRTDYVFQNKGEDFLHQNKVNLELEYAFFPELSLEADIPYTFLSADGDLKTHLDNINIGLKYANFYFEEKGLVLGGGLEFNLPTGSTKKMIGSSSAFSIAPVVDFGFKKGNFQAVAFGALEFVTNKNSNSEEPDTVFEYQSAVQYFLNENLSLGTELWGEGTLDADKKFSLYITPEVFFHLDKLTLGVGTSFPVTDNKEFQFMLITSLFYHFD